MMTFDRINRRTHLYLGLFLLPWLLMYGASSLLISHPDWFKSAKEPTWETVFDRECQVPVGDKDDPREAAARVLNDCGMPGAFWVQRRKPGQLEIMRFKFRDQTRLTYFISDHRLKAERQVQRADQVLVRLHFRGGFMQDSFWNDLWAVIVDLVCVTMLLWILTGLVMWWRLTATRVWGAIACGAGVLSFVIFVWAL